MSKNNDNGESLDTRSERAKAMDLASQIVSICLMPLLPGLGGYLLDAQFATKPVLTVCGLCLGLAMAAFQFKKFIARVENRTKNKVSGDTRDS